MLRENFFVEAACSYSLNWVLFWLFLVCFVFVLFCLFVRLFVLSQTSSLTLRRRQHDPNADSFLFLFVLKQMRLWPLIPSVFTGISLLVPGIDILMIVMKREAEAGGIVIVTVLSGQISKGFTLIIKPRAQSTGVSWVPYQRKAFPDQQKWK